MFKKIPTKFSAKDNQNQILVTDELLDWNIEMGDNSNLTFVTVLKKGWEGTKKVNFNFKKQNSTLTFIAIVLGTKKEKFQFETFSNHFTPRNNAYYYVRSAMYDSSEIDYTGNLIIKPQAQITDSYLAHHTLMLSPNAKTRTVPSLEIQADDVKAGHAATVGNMDDELIFYLESRGLNKRSAQDLLIKGFILNDLKKISDEKLQKSITEELK